MKLAANIVLKMVIVLYLSAWATGCSDSFAPENNPVASATFSLSHQGSSSDVVLQAFAWQSKWNGQHGAWYDGLKSKATEISDAGFSVVWFPPPGKTIRYDLGEHGDDNSAVGYMPLDYRDYGSFQQWVYCGHCNTWYQHSGTETLYGSTSELQSAVSTFHQKGIKVLADFVVNHRAGRQQNGEGEWCSWGDNLGQVASGYMVWGKNDNSPQQILNESGGSGGYEGTWSYGGRTYNNASTGYATELSHWNPSTRNDIRDYVLDLKNYIGFDGLRVDMVKGYDPQYVGEYSDTMNSYMTIGEWYEYNNEQALYDYVNRTGDRSLVFDWALKGSLTMAVKSQDFSGLDGGIIGAESWPRAMVTFVDNHDTGQSLGGGQRHNPVEDGSNDGRNRVQAYAVILSHPGIPSVYWYHWQDCGAEIRTFINNLISWRRQEGITAESSYSLNYKGGQYYEAIIGSPSTGKAIAIGLGNGSWAPATGGSWTKVYENLGYRTRIWTKD